MRGLPHDPAACAPLVLYEPVLNWRAPRLRGLAPSSACVPLRASEKQIMRSRVCSGMPAKPCKTLLSNAKLCYDMLRPASPRQALPSTTKHCYDLLRFDKHCSDTAC